MMAQLTTAEFLKLFQEFSAQGKKRETKRLVWLRCATDKEFFARYYFAHYCQLAFNELHHDQFSCSEFAERSMRRARAAPRGYAKSTIEALIEPIHDVVYGLESFIVIFSETQDQANQKLKDIRSEVLTNFRLIGDYGIRFPGRAPGETSFVISCGSHSCRFESYGSGTEVRGIRFGADRPSKVIVDDGENSTEVLNEALRAKKEDWFFQVVSKIGDTKTNIKVIGTILHTESLLAKLIVNPAYDGRIFKAVISWSSRQDLWEKWQKIYTNLDDADRVEKSQAFYDANEAEMLRDTKVLWPEKESYLYLMKEMIETGRRAFFKEKQNEPIGGDSVLFEKIHWYHETDKGFLIESTNTLIPWEKLKDKEGRWLSAYGSLDPATGQTKASANRLGDYSSLVTGMALSIPGREYKLRLFVHADQTKRTGPSKWIRSMFDHNEVYDYEKFAIETNLYRDLLLPNVEAERKVFEKEIKKEVRLPIYDVVNIDNKEKRIHTLEPKVTHAWILFNRALSHTAMGQLQSFPTPSGHDDFPDALEMLWGLVNNRFKPGGLAISTGGR
jgi:hypothetical protein